MSPRELGRIVWRHRWALALCLVIGVAAGLAFASARATSYSASALVMVEEESLPGLASLDLLNVAADARKVGTEMELLRSRALAKTVVDSLALQVQVTAPREARRSEVFSRLRVSPEALPGSYRLARGRDGVFRAYEAEGGRELARARPGEALRLPGVELTLAPTAARHAEVELAVDTRSGAVDRLVSALEVEQPGGDVNLIRVAYRGRDPELVRDVPNALTSRFMVMRQAMQKSEARSTVSLLREQLDTLATQLSSSEQRLQSFRESRRVVDPQLEASTQVGHLAELRAQRATLDAERSSLQRLLTQARAAEARRAPGEPSPYRRLIAFPTLLRNPAASEVLRSLTAVETERVALMTRRRPEDPEVQSLTNRMGELEQQLQAMTSTYLDGLASQVSAMDATLGQYRAELAQTPEKEVQFARLSRQPKVLEAMYGQLQTRLKEAEIAQSVDDASVRVVDAADLPLKPSDPHRGLLAGVSGVFTLLLGLGLVLVREYTDSSVRSRADVQAALGLPVLGLVPVVAGGAGARWHDRVLPRARLQLPSGVARKAVAPRHAQERSGPPALIMRRPEDASPLSDAYTRLHTNIMFARPEVSKKVLLLTSPLPGDGKTTTAINLATTLAESGLKVLLIDADLRRGSVHQAFGTPRGPGLSNLLAESPVLDGVLRSVDVGNGRSLRYITAGDHTASPVHLLGSPAIAHLLRIVSDVYDRVIIDSPPLNLFPDASVLSPLADGVVMVARAGVTPFDALVDAAEELRRSAGDTLGAVLNGVDFRRDASYDRAYKWYALSESYTAAADREARREAQEARETVALSALLDRRDDR